MGFGPECREDGDKQAGTAGHHNHRYPVIAAGPVGDIGLQRQIDRGETKSVRLIFDVTPSFLEAARSRAPVIPQGKVLPDKKATIRN